MRTLLVLALGLAVGQPLVRGADIPLDDKTIVLGERVGPIEKGMTLTGLKTLFGGGKVKAGKIPGAEGEEIDGARMFAGTDREIEIVFDPEGNEKEILEVRIIGKGWKFENGLKAGMTMTEVEKINGKAFQIMGFNWDYGGFANFEGGKMEGKVSVRFDPGEADVPGSLSGDRQISTKDKKLRALNPKVGEITVFLR
ncbi:MAG TPA: hypothetical protein VD994_01695 [Prosthecobacter sp.]|nr:hypothetical protein [Prosthecobacter sp.]